MSQLLPDKLKELWQSVEDRRLTFDEFEARKQQWMDEYKAVWRETILFGGLRDLKLSLVSELARFFNCNDPAEIERRCQSGAAAVKADWEVKCQREDSRSVERFYDESRAYIYDLMWWHTLAGDDSPLAYVVALRLAQQHACRRPLDFGAGVGAGSIPFTRHGFDSALADISSTLLDFSQPRV
ncbi:MAG: hypothetical protein KGJ60_04190 [Verrucomicrobiota bacterium]|nr:hypothetical protein [Verrucomicrobiota bacterium]